MVNKYELAAEVGIDPERMIYQDAWNIYEGACNPLGVSLTINEACVWLSRNKGGSDACKHPAIVLMLEQLAWITADSSLSRSTSEDYEAVRDYLSKEAQPA